MIEVPVICDIHNYIYDIMLIIMEQDKSAMPNRLLNQNQRF